jgi:acetolactate synthase-1/2/3 large subunit
VTRELVRFAEALRIPVFAAWRRQDSFPNDHPLFLGLTGYGAARTVRPRLLEADALLVIGCRLNEITTFDYVVPGRDTPWAHIDLEPRTAHAGLRAPEIAVPADAGAFLRAALAALEVPEASAAEVPLGHVPEGRDTLTVRTVRPYEAATIVDDLPWDGPGVHPGRVITTLQRVLPAEAILTTDAGNFGLWTARGYRFRQPGTFLGPTSGAMGYALPAGIAASLARPGVPVVALAATAGSR